jgi:hypothetical protein
MAVLLAACSFDPSGTRASGGDGGAGGPDARAADPDAANPNVPDAANVDVDAAPACAAPPAGTVGAPCATGAACTGTNSVCLDEGEGWPSGGYCSRACTSDADCGGGARCSSPLGDSRVCLATCCAGGLCGGAGLTCSRRLGGGSVGFDACVPGDNGAGDGDACETFGDCAPGSACSDNPFESPGGYCVTIGCTPGDDSTCAPAGDGTCIDPNPFDTQPAVCVDSCSSSGECRTSQGYACAPIDIGRSACLNDHLDPGAGCSSDGQCGSPPWDCLTGDDFPGGYCGADDCTGDPDACPEGAFCGIVDGNTFCVARCEPGPVACRFLEGYECVEFSGGSFGCIHPD